MKKTKIFTKKFNSGIREFIMEKGKYMKAKRIVGIVILIGGFVMLGFSYYIRTQVAQGQMEVSSAQRKVDRGSSLFNLTPYTKDVGRGIMGSAQSRIDEGKMTIAQYESLANTLQIGGFVCIAIGAIVIFLSRKK